MWILLTMNDMYFWFILNFNQKTHNRFLQFSRFFFIKGYDGLPIKNFVCLEQKVYTKLNSFFLQSIEPLGLQGLQ